jgi:2',3'-cyclic-nucleotide 2'-phosphodiesterase/3'-nucleotidase
MQRFALLLVFVAALRGAEVTVTVLATTDLHANIYPYDYFAARPADRGLAKIASLVRAVRGATPNVVLLDCGDTIQGSPLAAVYQQYARAGRLPFGLTPSSPLTAEPMMLAMNHIGYDAMTLGNHEFNFGLASLEKARAAAKFPWLAANVAVEAGARVRPFEKYLLKQVAGVRVAVIGITTPSVPHWEKPENYAGYRFIDGVQAARATLAEVRARHRPDLVLVAAHAGVDRDLKTGQPFGTGMPGENMVYQIAEAVAGVDAIVYGHSHQQVEGHRVGNTLLVQPKNWGISLARLDFVFETGAGAPKQVSSRSALIPVAGDTPADEEILRLAAPYHDLTERYLNTPFATSEVELDAALSRAGDTAAIDAIHQVQLHYARADVSFAASFNTRARVPKGPVTIRQAAALYIYENELYAIEGNGRIVREALENAARYYRTCPDAACSGPLVNPAVMGFNFETAQGVGYEIDLTQPEGRRIRNLTWRGKPLADDQPLRLAVNNYRAAGSAGYTMFRGAKIVWRSHREIRDLLIDYYMEKKTLPAKADDNWRIVPAAARAALAREAARE